MNKIDIKQNRNIVIFLPTLFYFQTMKKNKKEREEDRSHEPEMIDGQMLWFLMQHLRRSRRAVRFCFLLKQDYLNFG